ncbi:monooxygenase FAD-binding protein [Exophiala viscosa]|uniref:Monooxygenase FAD-binding protein n=1 Tax=Exophiala viscosa TaxID=2486360 RepID=A0AAN6I8W9_9EURO|nr:monooxygenase FAD-binding protein [Exophiala viscosa]
MSTKVTVLIIGCGIAGPVLANFLKRKGYDPIVFEKVSKLGDVGASLMLMPNGLKVLNLVGVADEIEEASIPLEGFLDHTSKGELLGSSDLPSSFRSKYGLPAMGVKRTDLNLKLRDMVANLKVDVREGWELENIEETDDSVTAHFNAGRSVTGSFLIGCDGIKAATRRILLRKEGLREDQPLFTGLTQTAGLSRTPETLKEKACLRNWFGEGVHMIAYPVSPETTSWALTLPEGEGNEADWGLCSPEETTARKEKLHANVSSWTDRATKELIQEATRLIKFGIFDREEMKSDQWHSRRCVLVGDAAHPTSPHLGQGANQALEDCFHLSHSLPYLAPESDTYEMDLGKLGPHLVSIFQAYAHKRQPRTSALVKGARAQGQTRVVTTGPEDCKKRNEKVATGWKDVETIAAKFDALCREPFQSVPS